MYPTHYLEWFHLGAWHRIGWVATTPQAVRDLEQHAEALAVSNPGYYRIVTGTLPARVVREWRAAA